MELKLNFVLDVLKINNRFNRTFMELKLEQVNGWHTVLGGFNRTFMELKQSTLCAPSSLTVF